jgi:hypothetical protein
MDRIVVAVDDSVGISPQAFADAWAQEPEATEAGPSAKVEATPGGSFLPDVAEMVIVPMAVHITSTMLYNLVRRVLKRAGSRHEITELEVAEFSSASGDRVVVARARREVR